MWLIVNHNIFNHKRIKVDAAALNFGADIDTSFFIICASSDVFEPFTFVVIQIDTTGGHLS